MLRCSIPSSNTSKRWCPSTPAIRRARSAPAASSTTCARSCRASHRGHRPRRRRGVAAGGARPADAGVQRAPGHGAVSPAWSADPHRLRVRGGRAIGLGACDIKGAAAGLVAAAAPDAGRCRVPVLQRRGGQRCALHRRLPPGPLARPRLHRGDRRRADRMRGGAGASRHQLGADALPRQRRPRLRRRAPCTPARCTRRCAGAPRARPGGRRGAPALRRPDRPALQHRPHRGRHQGQRDRAGGRSALRLPAAAVACHGRRCTCASRWPRPARSTATRRPSAARRCRPGDDVAQAEERRLAARDLAESLGLPIGNAVDFWTEASLFSAAGLTAIVYGPGDIAQAHTADEWVALEQLQRYAESIVRILETPRGSM
jgi:acetylornithine deacetylase